MHVNKSKSWLFTFVRYCGTILPSDFTSTNNELFIKFHSDSDGIRPGFLISYQIVMRHCSITLCKEGEGECGLDSECEGALVCGHKNCANSTRQHCCTKSCNNDRDCSNQECDTDIDQCRLDSYNTDWSKCSQDSPCSDGEGDCDNDGDCEGSLVCGKDKCGSGPSNMDCCIGKFVALLFYISRL